MPIKNTVPGKAIHQIFKRDKDFPRQSPRGSSPLDLTHKKYWKHAVTDLSYSDSSTPEQKYALTITHSVSIDHLTELLPQAPYLRYIETGVYYSLHCWHKLSHQIAYIMSQVLGIQNFFFSGKIVFRTLLPGDCQGPVLKTGFSYKCPWFQQLKPAEFTSSALVVTQIYWLREVARPTSSAGRRKSKCLETRSLHSGCLDSLAVVGSGGNVKLELGVIEGDLVA